MTNQQLAEKLKQLGNLLVIAGEDESRAARFPRLAYTISRLSEEIEVLCRAGRLCEIPGVGPAMAALLSEILATGTCRKWREWERYVPATALELLTIPGIGARTARHLVQDCNINSLEALETEVQRGTIAGLDTRTATTLRKYFRHRPVRRAAQTLSLMLDDEAETTAHV